MFQLIFEGQLYSVNKSDSNKKEEIQKELKSLFYSKYGMQNSKGYYHSKTNCYFLITYFYKGRLVRDIDNILKHTIDAFIKVMYKDDRSVKFCLSQAINCDNTINMIDITNLDSDIVMKLQDFSSNKTYKGEETAITYIECGEMTNDFYHVDLEHLWK